MIKRLTGIALLATGLATGAMADGHPTKVPFALDWKFEGPSAAYFAAVDNGHFKAEGLDVEISAGLGDVLTDRLGGIFNHLETLGTINVLGRN